MWRRLIVTLAMIVQTGATGLPANPHTISIRVTGVAPIANGDVLLGVAVLGHHVGRLEDGWLVKQAGPGILQIDWTKGGDWDGLTRNVEGPRDVSQAQLDAVVRAIEGLGFAPSAIRAWRVAAPVGYDGFNEGDKVLTIGEILVDLGSIRDAPAALARWWKAIDEHDPFEKIPRTNVRYAVEPFLQPDCGTLEASLRDAAVARANAVAASIAQSERTAATFAAYRAPVLENIVCPLGTQPRFLQVSGAPPLRIRGEDFEQPPASTVTYAIAGLPAQPAQPDDLPAMARQYAFALREPYAGTIGTAVCAGSWQSALSYAMADSRRRAVALAGLIHARVTRLGAARVSGLPSGGAACEELTIDAAWLLADVPHPERPLVNAGYSAGAKGSGERDLRFSALLTAAREAVVDDPHIVSLYETAAFETTWQGTTTVNETLIVQR